MVDVASKLVLSLFPGAGLLDRAFEVEGFRVVRGPDLITGGDIREYHVPAGLLWGVIGGPPCQDFSSARRDDPTGYGLEMLAEFVRVVSEAEPEWWLAENVSRVPDIVIDGYHRQRIDVDQRWFCDVSRLRHVQFGSRSGRLLQIDRGRRRRAGTVEGAALASDKRSFAELCRLQGLPDGFDLPGHTVEGKKRAVGNGVPIPMGAYSPAPFDRPSLLRRRRSSADSTAKPISSALARAVAAGA